MSIRKEWMQRVTDKELFKLDFLVPTGPERRIVLMSPEVNSIVCGPWPNDEASERCTRLRADLENILAGNGLVVCDEPYNARSHHQIGRLNPLDDHIFDIRSPDPSPGLRIVFHFAEKDVLVLHVCNPRSIEVSWIKRLALKGSSKQWKKAIADSKAHWSTLFPKHEPHKGDSIHDYLSNAVLV